MRVATWNLQRKSGAPTIRGQLEILRAVEADVLVLTEVHPSFMKPGSTPVLSDVSKDEPADGAAWVAILGDDMQRVDIELRSARFAAAAAGIVGDEQVVVYGSVLPWRSASKDVPDRRFPGENSRSMFRRVLGDQVADIHQLQGMFSGALLIWAGDFNQSLSGPNKGGSDEARQLLREALSDLGLAAWNEHARHKIETLKAIDLICGPSARPVTSVSRIDPNKLSDHAGYLVTL